MEPRLLKQPSVLNFLPVVCGLGLLLGIASTWLSPALLLIGVAGIVYVVVALLWPEYALLGILLFTSTIFDIYAYPSIPIGIGNLIISDILIFVLLAIIVLGVLFKATASFVHTPLDWPLLAFYFTALLATALGIYFSRVTFNQSLGEVRVVNFYLIFFIVTNLVKSKNQLRRLYNGIILLAVFVAMAMILQYVVGNAIQILPGRVETLNTAGTSSFGITRVLPPGQSLVLIAFVCLVVQLIFDKTPTRVLINFIQLGIVGFAVLLTFNRSFWAAIFFALVLVWILISIREKVKYANLILGMVLLASLVLVPFIALRGEVTENLIRGVTVRLSTLIDPDTPQEESLVYRYIENDYAYEQIKAHPLIGLGLGAPYRPTDRRIGSSGEYYIHNGHFWVMLKTGIIGYLFFMWVLLSFIKRSFQHWRKIPDAANRGLLLATGVMVFGMLFVAIVNPLFRDWYWAPIIGVMLGMGEVVLKLNQDHLLLADVSEKGT